MYYKPHSLYIRTHAEERDAYGRLVSCEGTYEYVAPCRCDDAEHRPIKNDIGEDMFPKYHIVIEGHVDIPYGAYIKVTEGDCGCGCDCHVRCEGKVIRPKRLNYLDYTEIWV